MYGLGDAQAAADDFVAERMEDILDNELETIVEDRLDDIIDILENMNYKVIKEE